MILDSTLDLSKDFNNKKNKYEKDLINNNIKQFYNKIEYKTKLLNIDSSFRNKIPKNIYKSNNIILSDNPLTTVSNSNIVKINYPNHNYSINDRIIIQNVLGNIKTLTNSLHFFINFPYMFVNFNNHNIPLNYLDNVNELKVSIDIINDIGNTTLYGNIPINAITGIFDIYLPSIINKTIIIPTSILSYFNVSNVSDLDTNYFLIQLPFSFSINTNIYYVPSDVYRINILSVGGIPLYYINSDYPINYQRYQGYQQIVNIDKDNIYIQTSIKASFDGVGGGSKIQIMLITNTLNGYPDANNYSILLKRNFNNVVRIELTSTEIPFIDFLVKSSGPYQNNKLYWKHYDDGATIYQVEIPEGNYDGPNLISTISKLINEVPRITSTIETPIYNIFDITLDLFTQEIKFSPYKYNNLPNSLSVSLVDINNIKYVKLTIYHPGNFVELYDTITVSNANKIGTIIDASYININHTIYEINTSEQTYSVLLKPLNQITNQSTIDLTGNGGPGTIVKTRAKVSFLFTYSDTLGKILNFKNVGEPNAITPFNTIISNFTNNIQSTNLNQVGNIDNSNKLLNLTGSNLYILMYLNDYECVINNSNQSNAFAKILLSGSIGDILFNTFINYPLEFDFPISTLNEINIKFTYPDGTLVDFRNIDHSFTLQITEQIIHSNNVGINSKDTSYLDTLIESKN